MAFARVIRCCERSAAEAPIEVDDDLSLNILFNASLFLSKTAGRMNDKREMSSVRLFWRGWLLVLLRRGCTVPVRRTRKFAVNFMRWTYCLLKLFLSMCPSSKIHT